MPWPGMSRREANHEKNESKQFIKQKARHAQEKAIEKDRKAKADKRKERNNRREW